MPRRGIDGSQKTGIVGGMFLRVFAVVFAAALLPRFAAAQDGPAINADAILRDLEQIEQKQKDAMQSARVNAINQLRNVAANGNAAADLYERAVEETRFEGSKNKGVNYQDWKANNAPLLRDKLMQTVLMLHLRYLVLSLERGASDKPEIFVQPSLTFANDMVATDALFLKAAQAVQQGKGGSEREKEEATAMERVLKEKVDLLDKSVADGVFAKWLRLGQWLPSADKWELAPGKIAGILEKNVRPVFREAKNPQLLDTWTLEMKLLADRVTALRLEHENNEFNNVIRPRMQFSMAQDMIVLGQKNRAATEVYNMIKTYPGHPDFSKWVAALKEMLKTSAPAPAAPAADTAQP